MAGTLVRMEGVRIGSPESLVKPGDPVPGKPGHYYEAGQYAPSPEKLSALKIQESIRAGLLPALTEHEDFKDLFDKNGEVNTDKLKTFDFSRYFLAFGFKQVDENLPPFAAIGVLSSLLLLPKSTFKFAGMNSLWWVANIGGLQEAATMEEQMQSLSQTISLITKNAITGFTKNKGEFDLIILQPYFVYMSVPIVPAIPGITSGLSIATASTIKTMGTVVGKKVSRNVDLWREFLQVTGWKNKRYLLSEDVPGYFPAGWELGTPRKTNWVRNVSITPLSANFTLSPMESFSEAFLYYWTHRTYMEKINKDLLNIMQKIIEYIDEVA